MSRKHPKKKSPFQKIVKSKIFHWIDFYGTPLFILIVPLFFVFKSFDIKESELKNIDVTVAEKPESTKERKNINNCFGDDYNHINIKTENFKRDFRISNFNYKASKSNWILGIQPNDKITLKILKEDFSELKDETYWNNYNNAYGLIKDGKSYINLDLRSELKSKDIRWLLIISLIGLIMFIYSFIRKPKIRMQTMIYISCSILIIVILIFNER